jgi:hypothetical protein
MLRAVVFTVFDCGFIPRCALEISDSDSVRLEKIIGIIDTCALAFHDISCTALDRRTGLPRFNMPFELGLFLGARRFGTRRNRLKACLVLDCTLYRYRKFISDLAGNDIVAHGGSTRRAVVATRDWLAARVRRTLLPGGGSVWRRYIKFQSDLPSLCQAARVDCRRLTYHDFTWFVARWLKKHELSGSDISPPPPTGSVHRPTRNAAS